MALMRRLNETKPRQGPAWLAVLVADAADVSQSIDDRRFRAAMTLKLA
jgi:hypothetical protein